MSARTAPTVGTSSITSRRTANAGTFSNVTPVTLPAATSQRTRINPAGASSTNSVTGSRGETMPVSSSTVATQIALLPDIAGYSVCSMITKPASASGWAGGRIRLQHMAGYPRGSRSSSRRRPSA
jgi:hypothetical protein